MVQSVTWVRNETMRCSAKWQACSLRLSHKEAEPTTTCSSLPHIDETFLFPLSSFTSRFGFIQSSHLLFQEELRVSTREGLPLNQSGYKKWKIVPLGSVDMVQKRRRDAISCQSKPRAVVCPIALNMRPSHHSSGHSNHSSFEKNGHF